MGTHVSYRNEKYFRAKLHKKIPAGRALKSLYLHIFAVVQTTSDRSTRRVVNFMVCEEITKIRFQNATSREKHP